MKLLISLLVFGLIAPALHAQLAPILDCIDYDPTARTITGHWGYVNTGATNKTINPGPGNFFTPAPSYQGQPVTFLPGMFHDVFQAAFSLDVTTSSSWHLQGITQTAT